MYNAHAKTSSNLHFTEVAKRLFRLSFAQRG